MVSEVSVGVPLLYTPAGEPVVEVVVAVSESSEEIKVVKGEAISLEKEESGPPLGRLFKTKKE